MEWDIWVAKYLRIENNEINSVDIYKRICFHEMTKLSRVFISTCQPYVGSPLGAYQKVSKWPTFNYAAIFFNVTIEIFLQSLYMFSGAAFHIQSVYEADNSSQRAILIFSQIVYFCCENNQPTCQFKLRLWRCVEQIVQQSISMCNKANLHRCQNMMSLCHFKNVL